MGLRSLLMVAALAAALMAGCIGGDDVELSEDDQAQEPLDDEEGRITGVVFTVDLDPIEGARVVAVDKDVEVAEATTDAEGAFTMDVEPGQYRVQVSAPCCQGVAKLAVVEAGKSVELAVRLEPYSKDDLQEPYVKNFEWTGFIACSVRARSGLDAQPYSGVSVCSIVDPTGQDNFLHTWEITEGVETVVGGMTWRNPGFSVGDELSLIFEVAGRANSAPNYAYEDGVSPLEFRADAGDVLENYDENIHEYDFQNVEESLELMYRVFAGGQVTLVYQQPFTVYWDVYYWEPAPEGATALPDQ